VIEKALAYITRGDQLLVFRQPAFPEQGIQVPGGSVEPGEDPRTAVLREASEETGLNELCFGSYLGSVEYQLKVDVGPPHLRHFFHLTYAGPLTRSWSHRGSRRPNGDWVEFELWWEPISRAKLDWEMDVYLGELSGAAER
jgi:8-oxo-dGTP pyrophosphatase MutT (NUDIX family)